MDIRPDEISKVIDGPAILDRMHDHGINISRWCRAREINPRTFYKTMAGDLGRRRSAQKTKRIVQVLAAEGFFVRLHDQKHNSRKAGLQSRNNKGVAA